MEVPALSMTFAGLMKVILTYVLLKTALGFFRSLSQKQSNVLLKNRASASRAIFHLAPAIHTYN